MSIGRVLILSVLNARTRTKDDFISNNNFLRELQELLPYESDEVLPPRYNPDLGTNNYGTKLLTLCKSSGLRILDGRHKHNPNKDFTFVGAKGLSVIDYCLSTPEVFKIVEKTDHF